MSLLRDEAGTSSIEYALIGSIVSIGIIAGLSALGGKLTLFYDIVAALVAAAI